MCLNSTVTWLKTVTPASSPAGSRCFSPCFSSGRAAGRCPTWAGMPLYEVQGKAANCQERWYPAREVPPPSPVAPRELGLEAGSAPFPWEVFLVKGRRAGPGLASPISVTLAGCRRRRFKSTFCLLCHRPFLPYAHYPGRKGPLVYFIQTEIGLLEALDWKAATDGQRSESQFEIQTQFTLKVPLRLARAYPLTDGENTVGEFKVDMCLPDGRGRFAILGRCCTPLMDGPTIPQPSAAAVRGRV